MNFPAGCYLALDKPYRQTSFQTVRLVRGMLQRRLGQRLKVGHAGTLDPLATGVLVICTGRATRTIETLQAHSKEYVAELRLGATTPSFDLEHDIDATFPTAHITPAMVEEALSRLTGDVMQVPPSFSACHTDGKRAYELARKGKEVLLEAKPIRIDEIEILDLRLPDYLKIRVACGKGTYIRALARDIGLALGSGAHLLSLRRTRTGIVTEAVCWQLPQFEAWLATQTLEKTLPEGPAPKTYPFLKPNS